MDLNSKEGIRHVWRKCWLWSLHSFTSLKDQEELWLAKRPGEMQTFDECMCCYFDDTFHGQSLDHWCTEGFLSQAEVDTCRDFHHLAHTYTPPPEDAPGGDDRLILVDPKWHHVVAVAQDTWKRLRSLITSEEERDIMDDCDKQQRSEYEA